MGRGGEGKRGERDAGNLIAKNFEAFFQSTDTLIKMEKGVRGERGETRGEGRQGVRRGEGGRKRCGRGEGKNERQVESENVHGLYKMKEEEEETSK